jgi:hypothetical protein
VTAGLSFHTRHAGLPRVAGGLAALTFPTMLVVLAIGTGFRRTGDFSDIAVAFLAAFLLLVAEPTAWLFSFDFLDADRFTIVFVGALTSFPLWYLAGSALAARAERWKVWVWRYTVACVGWTALNMVVFIAAAALFG